MLQVKNPENGEVISEIEETPLEDLPQIFSKAKVGSQKIKKIPVFDIYKILKNSAEEILQRKQELAELITKESGKPIRESLVEISRSYSTLLFSAEESKRIYGETISTDGIENLPKKLAITRREPRGVILCITPFNFPLNLVLHKVGPAIASKNSVVLKPSNETPLTALKLEEILKKNGLPEDAFQVVIGSGSVLSETLLKQEFNMLTFTGSVRVGKKIQKQLGIVKTTFELGGNDPLIIFEDADLDKAIKTAVAESFGTNGQRCTAVKRILIQDTIKDRFVEKFIEETKKLKVGSAMDKETIVSCLINEKAAIEVERKVNDAVQKGAKILIGGERKNTLYLPTIVDNVSLDSELVVKETFGPVAPIIPFKTKEEAIELANSTEYGLQSGVFTNRMDLINYCYDNLQVGAVNINQGPGFRVEYLPFGGVKNTGFGREGIKYAIEEMTESKSLVL